MEKENAWREHFSRNAADLLAIYSWASGVPLQVLLMACFRRSASHRINERTAGAAIKAINDGLKEMGR